MTYFAKTNTADPSTGFISVGAVLTDKQVERLGAERIAAMVARGILGTKDETPKPTAEAVPESAVEPQVIEEDEDLAEITVDEVAGKPAKKRTGRRSGR